MYGSCGNINKHWICVRCKVGLFWYTRAILVTPLTSVTYMRERKIKCGFANCSHNVRGMAPTENKKPSIIKYKCIHISSDCLAQKQTKWIQRTYSEAPLWREWQLTSPDCSWAPASASSEHLLASPSLSASRIWWAQTVPAPASVSLFGSVSCRPNYTTTSTTQAITLWTLDY